MPLDTERIHGWLTANFVKLKCSKTTVITFNMKKNSLLYL